MFLSGHEEMSIRRESEPLRPSNITRQQVVAAVSRRSPKTDIRAVMDCDILFALLMIVVIFSLLALVVVYWVRGIVSNYEQGRT